MDQYTTPPTIVAPTSHDAIQRQRDIEQLKILSILHYVFGGLTALGGCCGVFYVFIGIAIANDPQGFANSGQGGPPPPPWMGTMFAVGGGCFTLFSLLIGTLTIYAGFCLMGKRHRTFCMIMAGLMCLSVPLGTLLGIFTLVVLSRTSVSTMFAENRMMA